MFRTIFYCITAGIAFSQGYAIIGNFIGRVHGSTIWMLAPITVLCFGILAILEAIDKRKI